MKSRNLRRLTVRVSRRRLINAFLARFQRSDIISSTKKAIPSSTSREPHRKVRLASALVPACQGHWNQNNITISSLLLFFSFPIPTTFSRSQSTCTS
jgi:hypothetical protein